MNLLCKIFGHKSKTIKGDCFCASTVTGACIVKLEAVACVRCQVILEYLPHKHIFRKGSKILTDEEVKNISDAYKVKKK